MTASEPVILPSAGRHGVDPEDALHVLRNPVRTFAMDEEMTMVIGADRVGRLIEVGVVENHDEPGLLVVHAMPARAKFLKEW